MVKVYGDGTSVKRVGKADGGADVVGVAGAEGVTKLLAGGGDDGSVVTAQFVEGENGHAPYSPAWSKVNVGQGTVGPVASLTYARLLDGVCVWFDVVTRSIDG